MPSYKLYTPSVIQSKAEFTSKNYSYTATALTFYTDSSSFKRRLFKLPLIPTATLSRYADITVVVTVGLESAIRISRDSDPKIFISDGERGIGFDIRDGTPLCQGMQAIMGDVMGSSSFFTTGTSVQSTIIPEEFILTISPLQQWGSCHIAIDSGVISPVTYTQSIYLDKGLWLEMYREDASAQYIIKLKSLNKARMIATNLLCTYVELAKPQYACCCSYV